ncbi:MAG TPA: diguanylate cyclase [Candidatus Omnitrophota bacterium]|nr:diguanylate cyclase [Candidatus Omnitrophota bacterium]HPS36228.1 diguanylate cyclase [Candidatus Omnitrophota bacterium]
MNERDEQEKLIDAGETTEKLFTRTRSRQYRDWMRVGVYLLIIGIFTLLCWGKHLDRFENLVLDGFLRSESTHRIDPSIVLIKISEQTLREIGSWPWPRRYHAVMARLLSEWGAAAVLFDIDLSTRAEPKDDQDLAQVLRKIPTPVYLPVDLKPQKERKFWIHGMPVVLDKDEGKMHWIRPLPEFVKSAKGVGHRHVAPDPDGVLRRFDPFWSQEGETYPFLSIPVGYDFLKRSVPSSLEWKRFMDDQGKVIIPWTSRWDEGFIYYNYADLVHSFYAVQKGLNPVISPDEIAGKICLVGVTTREGSESNTTPLEIAYPFLGTYAHVLNSVLTHNWIRPAPFWANLLCLIAIGIVAASLFMALRSSLSLLAGLLLGLSWFGFCFLVFLKAHWWFFSVYPLFLILILFIFSAVYVQFTATREKSHLFHLATRDGLTELYVIRHFRLIMNQIVREALVRRESLSIILFDIDDFKKINDTYGHPAGDMVLKKVAAIILSFIRKRRPFREIDFAARYGGEEFIVMLRKANLREAANGVAERIRQKVETTRFEWDGKTIPVRISLGVAMLHGGESVPDPMVHRADAALYKAKQTGKNRVCTERD